MRRFLYLTAIALSLGLSADAFAQGGGGSGGGMSLGGGGSSFGGGGTSLGGGGGLSGGGTSLGGGGGLIGGGSSLGGGSTFSGGGTTFSGGGTTFGGGGMSYGGGAGGGRGVAGGSGAFQISPTNPFSGTFGNPMYYGRPGSTNVSMGAGGTQLKGSGFGQPSFGTVSTASGTTGIAGRTGTATVNNRGLTGGYGGLGGANSTPQVSYTAQVGFRAPPVVAPTIRLDLQAMVGRSSALRVPGNVRVEAAGDVIVLRGKVADEDEKRLVEGMVRLEPGVHEVRNELEIGP
jgi:BON domain